MWQTGRNSFGGWPSAAWSSSPRLQRPAHLDGSLRQVPVSERSLSFCVLLVRDPENRPQYFVSQSLLFSSFSSVYSFNRISKSLSGKSFSALAVFYNDYPFLESTAAAPIVFVLFRKIPKLRHWIGNMQCLETRRSSFIALGAEVYLSSLHLGVFSLSNKPGRIQRIVNLLMHLKEIWPPKKHDLQVWSAFFNIRQVCRLALRFGYPAVLSVPLLMVL